MRLRLSPPTRFLSSPPRASSAVERVADLVSGAAPSWMLLARGAHRRCVRRTMSRRGGEADARSLRRAPRRASTRPRGLSSTRAREVAEAERALARAVELAHHHRELVVRRKHIRLCINRPRISSERDARRARCRRARRSRASATCARRDGWLRAIAATPASACRRPRPPSARARPRRSPARSNRRSPRRVRRARRRTRRFQWAAAAAAAGGGCCCRYCARARRTTRPLERRAPSSREPARRRVRASQPARHRLAARASHRHWLGSSREPSRNRGSALARAARARRRRTRASR